MTLFFCVKLASFGLCPKLKEPWVAYIYFGVLKLCFKTQRATEKPSYNMVRLLWADPGRFL